MRFQPVDDGAKGGNSMLLRDATGHLHCARWQAGRFVYGSGTPILAVVTDYARRDS